VSQQFLLGFLWLVADALVLGVVVWRMSSRLLPRKVPFEIKGLASAVLAAALVMALGNTLGYAGILGPIGFTFGFIAIAAAWWLWERRTREPSQTKPAPPVRSIGKGPVWRVALPIVFFVSLVAAGAAHPLVVDDLAYRLPRIGLWLQEASIRVAPGENQRIAFMGTGGDLLQAWIVGHFPVGFPMTALPNAIGGWMMAVVTATWTRSLGLPSLYRWVVAAALLCTPIVTAQMTVAQVDLLVGGLIAAGIYFLWRSLATRRFSCLPALAFAAALATKSTTLLLAPACCCFLFFWGGLNRKTWPLSSQLAVATVVACLALAGPRYLENLMTWKHPLGPPTILDQATSTDRTFKLNELWHNAVAYALQNFYPATNAPFVAGWTGEAGKLLTRFLLRNEDPDRSPTWSGVSRTTYLNLELDPNETRMETLSFGALTLGTGIAGVLWALAGGVHSRRARLRFTLAVSTLLVAFFACTLMVWQPWGYRFFTAFLPLFLPLTAYAFHRVPGGWLRFSLLAGWLFAQAAAAHAVWTEDTRSGMHAIGERRSASTHQIVELQRGLMSWFEGAKGEVHVALSSEPNQTIQAGLFYDRSRARPRVVLQAIADLRAYPDAATYLETNRAAGVFTIGGVWEHPGPNTLIVTIDNEHEFYRWVAYLPRPPPGP
jgi:hypothetical protein